MGWKPQDIDMELWKHDRVRVLSRKDGNCLYQSASFGLHLKKVSVHVLRAVCFCLKSFKIGVDNKLTTNHTHNRNLRSTMNAIGVQWRNRSKMFWVVCCGWIFAPVCLILLIMLLNLSTIIVLYDSDCLACTIGFEAVSFEAAWVQWISHRGRTCAYQYRQYKIQYTCR